MCRRIRARGARMHFFNNCKARDHERLFGPGAFFDLDTTGHQATLATELGTGEQCIVVEPGPDGALTFDWYTYQRDETMPDDAGIVCRVLFGDLIKTETRSKADAISDGLY